MILGRICATILDSLLLKLLLLLIARVRCGFTERICQRKRTLVPLMVSEQIIDVILFDSCFVSRGVLDRHIVQFLIIQSQRRFLSAAHSCRDVCPMLADEGAA